jgi:signal transduction histidine kinase
MFDYSTIEKTCQDIAWIRSTDELYEYVGVALSSALDLSGIFLISSISGGGYEVVYSNPVREKVINNHGADTGEVVFDEDSLISRCFKETGEAIVKDGLSKNNPNNNKAIEEIEHLLKSDLVGAVVPVFVDGGLALLIVPGEKLTGGYLTEKDLSFLGIVAHQTAAALHIIRLEEEKIDSSRFSSIGLLSASIAHEMRNSLTSLKTFAQLFPEKYNDPDFRSSFSRIVPEQMEIIEELIKDFPVFSIKETGTSSETYNLTKTIDESIDYVQARHRLKEKNIVIEKRYGNNAINMSNNPLMLKYALINILDNGCEAMDCKGDLRVNVDTNGVLVKILIQDYGEGISLEDINKIFEPFYTTKPSGIGLGLAISKKIIEGYGGGIRVKSRLTEGTVFNISLPVNNNAMKEINTG